ncbi:MAG: SpoIIE family protein phosphatase [Clostridia bacterium]|nr:SpoIIE family protein phosphatase [Clostridia bacterium]
MFQGLKSKFKLAEAGTFGFAAADKIKENDAAGDKPSLRDLVGGLKDVIVFILCGLVSACKMTSGALPFGIAIVGALGSIGVPVIVPYIVVAVITAIFFGGTALLKFLIAATLFVAIKSFIKNEDTKMSNAGIIIFSSVIAEIVGLSIHGVILYDALLAIYSSILVGIFYLIFGEGLPVIYDAAKAKVYSGETLISAGVMLAVAFCGFGSLGLWGITIRGVLSVLIVMILGWKRGAAIGAATGLSIALTLGLIGYGSVATVATYAFCGLLSGILSRFGKIGAAIGFILGNIVLALYANGSTEVIISIKEIVVASVALFVIPKKMLVVIDDLFDYNTALPGEVAGGYIEENTIYKLGAVSDVISSMAENVSNGGMEGTQADEIGSFIKTLNENTCRRCENYDKCWKENYHKMYELTFNAIETLQMKGEITSDHLEDLSNDVCTKKDLLAEGLNLSYEIYKLNKDWQAKVKEQRIQMALQLKEVSKEIDKVKSSIKVGSKNAEEEDLLEEGVHLEPYKLELGIAKAKKSNSVISGDSSTVIRLKDDKILVALSDGMGSGETAARNSKKVVLNLEKLLDTGFEEERAVKLINSYLLVGRNEDNFATIDAMVFDTISGITEFIKIGACPTFIASKKGQVITIEASALPVGIVEDVELDAKTKILKSGDTIVMLTDGILDANPDGKENAIQELLATVKNTSAQRLADIILQEAVDCNFGIARDDMTVIVARVV